MKVKARKNGSFKLTAQNEGDSEVLYMFLSGGKHSPKWFTNRIGKTVISTTEVFTGTIEITDKEHADFLFNISQNELEVKYSDPVPPSVQVCDPTMPQQTSESPDTKP